MNNKQPHPDDNRNLILAIVISLVVLGLFHFLYDKPRIENLREQEQRQQTLLGEIPIEPGQIGVVSSPTQEKQKPSQPFRSKRVAIQSQKLTGSIALTGARIDDLLLKNYDISLNDHSPVKLFSPSGSAYPYGGRFGWTSSDKNISLPSPNTEWQVASSSQTLAPEQPLLLQWDNGEGLVFFQKIALDEDYMFTVQQSVQNNSGRPVTLYPYGLITRQGVRESGQQLFILHEGPIGYIGGSLQEVDYDTVQDDKIIEFEDEEAGWIGITDKYWLSALIPNVKNKQTMRFSYAGNNKYQADFRGEGVIIQSGTTGSATNHLFAGAKELKALDRYEKELGIDHFDLAIDFGWFYFMTKPFFYLLSFLYSLVGNFGVAIIIFTVIIRLILYPLASKGYRSMAGMKKVAPQLTALKEKYKDNREKMQQALMELYKKEKVNPLSGCLPILIQIPIFFALYKVLYVTIEMRHQPFFGWIQDLSLPDPTTIFNLFGLIPWNPPGFLMIGLWPIIMGATLFFQQKLNPKPQDPLQAKMMKFFPLFMVFLLARFPAGLVIYWSFSNLFSIAQQYVITRKVAAEEK